MTTLRNAYVFLVIATLAACSGGGGTPGSGPIPTGTATPTGSAMPTPTSTTATPTRTPTSTPTAVATTPTPVPSMAAKSAKRGLAYDLASTQDVAALASGTSWWYDYGLQPSAALPADVTTQYRLDFVPMLYNGQFDDAAVASYLRAHPAIRYVLVLNEPNLVDQANTTPQAAATLWPRYEAIAATTGVKIVGPQMTYGTMTGYTDPVVWLDAFYAAFRSAHGRDPVVDYLGFHWYDYGLSTQLDRLVKYGKPFWVTEFANWHSQNDGAQIDTLAKQETQMTDMVATLEQRSDVFRYAWFTGRISPDPHFDALLGASGTLTSLGSLYLSLPHS